HGLPAYRGLEWALAHDVDRERREVRVRILGGSETRAVFREGLGCLNVNGGAVVDAPTPSEGAGSATPLPKLPEMPSPDGVDPVNPELRAAIAALFAEDAASPRRTHAVVVVHRGRIVGERYAPGWGIANPMHGWSATKSITNALVGVLVR